LDLVLDGAWSGGQVGVVDLPLVATFHDTVLHLQGLDPTPLAELALPIGLSGPIDAPRVHFDSAAFADALAAAGKQQLANEVRARAEGELGEALEKAGVEVPAGVEEELQKQAGGVLGGLLGGKPKDGG
ncbi:MAG TPA: hypothetical protein VJP77_07595, partial [Planctomycetota bacterium]|nr:hypothetical protein [Planctomycetota bacterium]